jgi:hypothetical protein
MADLGKTSESKPSEGMTVHGGGSAGTGPTGSSRSYPKGGSKPANTTSAPFNPHNDSKRGGTSIYVGGV